MVSSGPVVSPPEKLGEWENIISGCKIGSEASWGCERDINNSSIFALLRKEAQLVSSRMINF